MSYLLPEALQSSDDRAALAHLRRYYGCSGGAPYTGAHFDDWRPVDPDRWTADDVVAVTFLSVVVPPMAAHALLVDQAARFAELLEAVGPDGDLCSVDETVDARWPAWLLYHAVRGLPGVGPTIASKLLARKRPRLLPIYDSVIDHVTGASRGQWEPLRTVLRADGGALQRRLLRLREEAGLPTTVSALRVYDVVCWMEGKASRTVPLTAEESLGVAQTEVGTPA